MGVPSASPCPAAQAAPGERMETCSGKVLLLHLCLSGRSRWRGLLGTCDGLSCSCCQLWVWHSLCLVSELLPVWVCLHPRASKGLKWLGGGMMDPSLRFPVDQEIKMFQMFFALAPSLKHTQGPYLAGFHGMMQHQRCCLVLNDSSKNELVLLLSTVKQWELRQYRINDLFYSEENYLQKK